METKDKSIIAALLLLFVVVVIGIAFLVRDGGSVQMSSEIPTNETAVTKIPTFSLQDNSGRIVVSESFKGTLLVANTWATWCPFCAEELEALATLQEEYEGDVRVVAINRAEPAGIITDYIESLSLETGDVIFLNDPTDSFYKKIGGFSVPETVVLSKDSQEILFHKRGPITLSEMRTVLDRLLSEQ